MQMGYFLQKAGLDYLILERSSYSGSFFKKFPIHRKLISINKKYNLFNEDEFNMRHDWNSLLSDDDELRLTNYTDELFPEADVLFEYLNDYAEKNNLKINYDEELIHVRKNDSDKFVVETSKNKQYVAKVLIMAIGATDENMPQEIEGIEHAMTYSQVGTDVSRFKNKRVCVLGGGNSAFETAEHLSKSAAFVHVFVKEPLKMAWDSHFVGDLRAVNNNILDLYQLKSLSAVLRPNLKKIEKVDGSILRTSHEYEYPESTPPGSLHLTREYDYIINCTGWNYSKMDFFEEELRPELTACKKFPLLKPNWESSNVPNLFFIGTAMRSNDKNAASGFIHGFRYNIRTLSKLLAEQYEGRSYESEVFNLSDWSSLLDDLYQRVSISAGLFQLFGYLRDLIVFSDDFKSANVYRELPRDYPVSIHETGCSVELRE